MAKSPGQFSKLPLNSLFNRTGNFQSVIRKDFRPNRQNVGVGRVSPTPSKDPKRNVNAIPLYVRRQDGHKRGPLRMSLN